LNGMHSLPIALLGAGGFMLLVLAAGTLLVLDSRSRVVAQRTAAVTRSYAQASTPLDVRPLRLMASRTSADTKHQLSHLIGLEIDRPDLYGTPWWIVLLGMVFVGFMVAELAVFFAGKPGWLAWPVGWFLGSRWYFKSCMVKYHDTLIRQMPDALGMIVRTVRAGIPVTEAFIVVARESPKLTAREFGILTGEISLGRTMDDGLWKVAARTGLREYRFLAVALTLQAKTGGNLTETLEKLAELIRKRSALRQRGKALSSEGRATAVILTVLPFLVAGALLVIQPEYILLLVNDPIGRRFLLGALGCLVVGYLTMRSMIRRSLA
jgi:tight adherence protein B